MADGTNAASNLEQHITCAVCHEHFDDPRILPCTHYYCKRCVQALGDQAGTYGSFPCPECRSETRLPQNDANQLPKELSIIRVMDLHKSTTSGSQHRKKCLKHDDPLRLYCEQCSVLVCGQCMAFDHRKHTCKRISDAAKPLREHLENKIATLKATRQKHLDAIDEAKAAIAEIEDENAKTTPAINQWVEKYVESIRNCGRDFIERKRSLSQQKIDSLNFQIQNKYSSSSDVLETVEQSCEKHLKTEPDDDFLENCKLFFDRANEVCRKHKGVNIKLDDKLHDSEKKWTEELVQACQSKAPVVESVQLAEAPAPPVVDKKARVSIGLLAADGTQVSTPQSVKGELISLVNSSVIHVQGARKRDGTYEMAFIPRIRGRHQLNVKVNDEQLTGNSISIFVEIDPKQLRTPVKVTGGLKKPYGLAFNFDNDILVTGLTRNIQVLDSKTKKIKRTFQNIRTSQALIDPKGIAIDHEDNVFVADCGANRVYKLDKYGNEARAIGRRGFGRGEFNAPAGITVVGEQVFVCDSDNHRIQVFDRDLNVLRSFGSRGTGNGEFEYAYDINSDEAGNLYVCDFGNDRIQVLNERGEFVRSFGTKGKGRGQLSGPAGVCICGQNVYISDFSNDRISVFHRNGSFVATFGSEGSTAGCFKTPVIVRVDKDGFVYVCDNENNRVQVF